MNTTDRKLIYAFMLLVLRGIGLLVYWGSYSWDCGKREEIVSDYTREQVLLQNRIKNTNIE